MVTGFRIQFGRLLTGTFVRSTGAIGRVTGTTYLRGTLIARAGAEGRQQVYGTRTKYIHLLAHAQHPPGTFRGTLTDKNIIFVGAKDALKIRGSLARADLPVPEFFSRNKAQIPLGSGQKNGASQGSRVDTDDVRDVK